MLHNITAIILCGGLGTRLRSVVSDRPKVLALVKGKPFITYLLDQLIEVGVSKVILAIGYLGFQIESSLGFNWKNSLSLDYSLETTPLGTGGAVRLAYNLVKSDPVLIMNGDSICLADLNLFYQWHSQKKAIGSILLTQVSDCRRFGRVQVDDQGVIIKFEEKGETIGSGWINSGVYLLSRSLIEQIPTDQMVSLERDIFMNSISNKLYGAMLGGHFLDMGTPDSYNLAQSDELL